MGLSTFIEIGPLTRMVLGQVLESIGSVSESTSTSERKIVID